GSLLIAALTASFLQGIEQNPDVPPEVTAEAQVELAGGIPFVSNADLEVALEEAGASDEVTQAVVEENEQARLDGLKVALAALALIALVGLFFTTRIPTRQPGSREG
ncbi:MAG TPA: MFS transporter, partial [Actinomycetota bacterium]|nr:MFS transporter [Actinomycetota bacterium]